MFTIEKFKVKEDALKLAKQMVRAQLGKNTRILGSGSYGTVYGTKNSNVVYKVGDADDNEGYIAFIKTLANEKTHNKFFPKIYGVRFIENLSNPSYWGRSSIDNVIVVAMEKLSPIDRKTKPAVEFFIDELEDCKNSLDKKEANEILGIKYIVPNELQSAITTLRKAAYSSSANWDLHSGNFMLRGKQIVVTDPLA
jgi:hypothetical protein